MHFWDFPDRHAQLVVLSSPENGPLDLKAQVTLLALRQLDGRSKASPPVLLSLKLDDPEERVREKVEAFVKDHSRFLLETFSEETVMDRFLRRSDIKELFLLTYEETFYHFAVNTEGRLEYMIQCTFNFLEVC